MPGYEGSLFDANGPMQFANQVRGIADALDSVNQKATAFFQSTQQGLDNLAQSLTSLQGLSGNFSFGGGGGGGGSGWSVSSGQNSGGTGGQRGNTTGVGGSGNRPGEFQTMTGGAPNGGFSAMRAAEAGIGVATGAAQRYTAQTQIPAVQMQLSAVQAALSTGQSISAAQRGIANNKMLATSMTDLATGAATTQNLFGVTMSGPLGGLQGTNQATIGAQENMVNLLTGGTLGQTGSAQALGSMMSSSALYTQLALTGTMFRQGGKYNSPVAMANTLYDRFMANMDDASFNQSLSPGSPMYQNLMNMTGGDPAMMETVTQLLRARRKSGSALPVNMTGGQAKALGLTSAAAVSGLQRSSSQAHMQAQLSGGQDAALTDFNRAMQGFYQAVNNIFGSNPGVAYGLGFGIQSFSSTGGPLGSILGTLNGATDMMGGMGGGGGSGGGAGVATAGLGGLGGGLGSIGSMAGTITGVGGLSMVLGALLPGIANKLPKLVNDMSKVYDKAASDIGNAIGGAVSWLGNAAGSAFSWLGNAGSSVGGAVSSAFGGAVGGVEHLFGGGGGGKSGGGSGGPVGDHMSLIRQSLKLAGIQDTSINENAVNLIVSHESSWNPKAINKTDSNAKAGHPSQGLMQTIPSTFAAYAIPGHNSDILDPLSNLIAGERYAVARYGSLSNVPGVKSVLGGGPYVGYESGSYEIERTKLALLHKGERVVRSADNTVSSRWGTSPATPYHIHYHLSSGAVTVSLAGVNESAARDTGTQIAEALMDRLARA